jgi:HAMP domain-containing protein
MSRRIVRPIQAMTGYMGRLAAGDYDRPVPFAGRGDEIGEMANSVAVFREAIVARRAAEDRIAADRDETEAAKSRHDAERRAEEAGRVQVVEALGAAVARLKAGDLTARLETAFPAAYEGLRGDFNRAIAGLEAAMLEVAQGAGGLRAGVATVIGLAILVYRRRTVGPVFSATTVMDKVMYAFLAAVIVLGMWNTVAGSILTVGGEYNYREGVSVWYRSFLAFQPDASLMADAPLGFQLHALVAFGLFALWPFTRLVHVFSAPLGYLTRPYIVYRSRDDSRLGSHRPRRGWDRVG